jgi:hypothetical protein
MTKFKIQLQTECAAPLLQERLGEVKNETAA